MLWETPSGTGGPRRTRRTPSVRGRYRRSAPGPGYGATCKIRLASVQSREVAARVQAAGSQVQKCLGLIMKAAEAPDERTKAQLNTLASSVGTWYPTSEAYISV